jgi:hypothetical protein
MPALKSSAPPQPVVGSVRGVKHLASQPKRRQLPYSFSPGWSIYPTAAPLSYKLGCQPYLDELAACIVLRTRSAWITFWLTRFQERRGNPEALNGILATAQPRRRWSDLRRGLTRRSVRHTGTQPAGGDRDRCRRRFRNAHRPLTSHLAREVEIITASSSGEAWAMAVGINLGFIAIELSQLAINDKVRKQVSRFARPAILGTLAGSAAVNAFALRHRRSIHG